MEICDARDVETFDAYNNNFESIKEFVHIFDNYAYLQNDVVDECATIYVCGYVAHSVSKKLCCSECVSFVTKTKGSYAGNKYFDFLQRSGLSIATERISYIFVHMLSIFEYIINDEHLENLFLKSGNQKHILCKLTFYSVKDDFYFEDFLSMCHICNRDLKTIFGFVCSIFANIMLNNYVKNKNNANKNEKSDCSRNNQKKRKLNTFNN